MGIEHRFERVLSLFRRGASKKEESLRLDPQTVKFLADVTTQMSYPGADVRPLLDLKIVEAWAKSHSPDLSPNEVLDRVTDDLQRITERVGGRWRLGPKDS